MKFLQLRSADQRGSHNDGCCSQVTTFTFRTMLMTMMEMMAGMAMMAMMARMAMTTVMAMMAGQSEMLLRGWAMLVEMAAVGQSCPCLLCYTAATSAIQLHLLHLLYSCCYICTGLHCAELHLHRAVLSCSALRFIRLL